MKSYQFIKFHPFSEIGSSCEFPLPIAEGDSFIVEDGGTDFQIDAVNLAGTTELIYNICSATGMPKFENRQLLEIDDLGYIMENYTDECFRLRYTPDYGEPMYSDPFIVPSNTEGLSVLRYYCKEEAFGIPFGQTSTGYAILQKILPINIKKPQLKQEDKIYTKSNGENVVLYSKHYKEWDAESEYIPEDIHEMLCNAISCDFVYLDDVRLTKSDSYEIDWDNTHKKACGQKLAKATWKMRANISERNSNC